MMTTFQTAVFFLDEMPLDELTDEFKSIAERVRNKTLPRKSALAYLTQTKQREMNEWDRINNDIDKELGSWCKI